MSMHVTTDRMNGLAVVRLQGEIDLQNSSDVRRELLGCLVDRCDVVVDLDAVEYIDSSGVASLIEAYQMAKRLGVGFSLAAASAAVLRVLRLARLDEVFIMHPDVDSAVNGR